MYVIELGCMPAFHELVVQTFGTFLTNPIFENRNAAESVTGNGRMTVVTFTLIIAWWWVVEKCSMFAWSQIWSISE